MFSTANVGTVDQAIRFILGVVLIILPYAVHNPLWANPVVAYAMNVVGVILGLTAIVRFCPLYRLVGATTCRKS